MKYSYVMLPDYPLSESLASIKLADQLGFYGCYAADETWHKDLWLLFAAAAAETTNIRFGPSLSSVVLREPTLIAQSVATLDELTGGRAEAVLSCGNFGLLAQYNIDWTTTKPLSRVKEAHHVVRTLLDDGAITFDGEFFKYSGLFTFARPVQEHVPVHDRRDAWPEVVPGRGRAVRRLPPRAQLHPGGLRLRRREHPHRRRAGRQGRRLARHRSVGRVRHRRRTRRRPRTRPGRWSGSTPRPCPPSNSSATASIPWSSSRSSTPSAPATSPRASS